MKHLAWFLPFFLLLCSCTNDPVQPEQGVVVTARNLPPSGDRFFYELWFSYPEQSARGKDPKVDHEESSYFPAGRFKVTDAGALVNLSGAPATFVIPEGYSPALIADAIVTLRSTTASNGSNDSLPGPIFLAGEFVGSEELGIDTLTLSGRHAFGSAMEDILNPVTAHRYILNTPTTPANDSDFAQGIWFAALESGRFDSTLAIPSHPIDEDNSEWQYESWIVDNRVPAGTAGRYISLGRFNSPAARDQNGAGPGAGPDAAAAYDTPGEDFVAVPGRVLNSGDYGVIVSLEPLGEVRNVPFITLLKRDVIPTTLQRIQPDSLSASVDLPMIEVRIQR